MCVRVCECLRVCDRDAPRPGSWLHSERHQVSADSGGGPRPGLAGAGPGCWRARARAGVWALLGMTTGSGPAPGGPWAGRACRGRGLRRRPRRPTWPPPAHPKSRAGGYAGRRRWAGRSRVVSGGLRWRVGRGRGQAAGRQARPGAAVREAGVAGPEIARAEARPRLSLCGVPEFGLVKT